MKKLSFLLAAIIMLSSCNKEFDEKTNEDEIQNPVENFLFNTTDEFSLTANYLDPDMNPVEGVYAEVYTESPVIVEADGTVVANNSAKLIYKGHSDQNGVLSTRFNLPLYTEKIYIKTLQPGFPDYREVSVSSRELTVTFGNEEVDTSGPSGSKKVFSEYMFLGEYNSVGYPLYKVPQRDKFDKEFLDEVNATLPESSQLPVSHPQYLESDTKGDLVLTADAEVSVTFVHEGAGWLNVLGYFHYPTDNPPASYDEVMNKIIAFPNVSYAGSGGALISGDKVELKYYNEETFEFEDTFPAGTTISWFMIADGWDGYVSSGTYTHYSIPSFNIETDPELQKHNVVLYDEKRDLFLIAFEDIRRDASHCDQDFNDAVFYATATPSEAVDRSGIEQTDIPEDSDNDGVSDRFDDFPEDNTKTYKNTYPSNEDFGTLAFEDLWPYKGDYDFNDLVLDYQFEHIYNTENKVSSIEGTLVLRAIGAGYHNGFGFQLKAGTNDIATVTGSNLYHDYISLNANGTEAGQSKATIIAFDNSWSLFNFPGGGGYINTSADGISTDPKEITIKIDFETPLDLDDIGIPPYNPFIIVNKDRAREVHLPGSEPTDLADQSIFGTGQDSSDPLQNKYYVSD